MTKDAESAHRVTSIHEANGPFRVCTVATYGKEYGSGKKIGIGVSKNGFENPVKVWIPSIAPSGMIIYKGDMFAEFKNKLIVGSLKFKRLHILTTKNKKIAVLQSLRKRRNTQLLDGLMDRDGTFNGGAGRYLGPVPSDSPHP